MKLIISSLVLLFSTIQIAQHSDPNALSPLNGILNGNNLAISFAHIVNVS